MKIREITDKIMKYHPNLPDYEGCDGFKSGNPEAECTGVLCTLVPTQDIVEKAVELGYNLIYTHEPSYYMTPDYPEWRGDFTNEVYNTKRKLLDDNGIAIFRDHDHTHAHRPDGIFAGVMKYLGWESYLIDFNDSVPMGYTFQIPETTVEKLNRNLIETIGMNGTRYIGRPGDKISRVAIVGHLFPGGFGVTKEENGFYTDYSTEIIRQLEEGKLDAIIPGEVIEWNVLSYIRDAVSQGKNKACFNIGHFNFEELGAKYAADWIDELLEGSVPVKYEPTRDMWSFELR